MAGQHRSGEAAAEDVAAAVLERDFGAVYEALHPEFQALTTRAAYTDCAAGNAAGSSPGEFDVEATDSFVEDGFTYVEVRVSGEGLLGEQSATVTIGVLEVDDEWVLVDSLGAQDEGQQDCIPGDESVRDALRS